MTIRAVGMDVLEQSPYKRGKVKDIYDLGNGRLVFLFTDRVSAYDIVLPTIIPRKGEVLCKLAAYWFDHLGVPNHMIEVTGPNRMMVRQLKMIPVECVVRGYLYGSLYDRVQKGEVHLANQSLVMASKLSEPTFDPTTKSDIKDEPITMDQILDEGWLSQEQLEELRTKSLNIYKKVTERADQAGFILADLKLEFGFDKEENIILADSIGPDEFRLWPKDHYQPGKSQESYDKQPIRDWLSKVGYKKTLDKARVEGEPVPPPPKLPDELVQETSRRYVLAYEKLTGQKL